MAEITKYRFSFIVETDKDPNTAFRKVWDAVEEIDRDTFGYYQIIHSKESWIRILEAVKILNSKDKDIVKALDKSIDEAKKQRR